MGYLDNAGLQYFYSKLKDKFAPKSHTHDDRYYTESEIDTKLAGKSNTNHTHDASTLINNLSSGTSVPTDPDYILTQYVGGGTSNMTWVRRPLSSLWEYIKNKTDTLYQAKGSYAASNHNHNSLYYQKSEINTKLAAKAESITLATNADLNKIVTPGMYSCGGGNSIANKPSNVDAIGLIVTHNASGSYYTQILTTSSNANTYRRTCLNGTWSAWTQDKYTDTNTWRGIQNNLTSDSTTDSLSAAQGKALKALVDGKAASNHTHSQYYDSNISRTANTVLAAPNGSAGGATFRKLVAADIPTHNQAWSTITGTPALMESGDYSSDTIEALLVKVQGTSPRMGSCNLAKDTHVANIWWNFIYTPHRTGIGGDNPNYGTLLLFPMTGSGSSYIIRSSKAGTVSEVRKIYTSGDKPSKTDVGLGNVDNTADANKSVKYATSAGSASKLSTSAGSATQPVYFSGGKPVACTYTLGKSVPSDAKFTDTTYGVATATANGLMSSTDKTKLDDFGKIVSIQKSIKLTTNWQDTGITGTNLETGTYVVQVSGFSSSYTQLFSEIYSGTMSWFAGQTNSTNSSEIFLHNAGHADNSNALYLRTIRSASNGYLKLQVAVKIAATGTDTLTFKFRRLI